MDVFSSIVGQSRAIKFLQAVLDGGRPSHAYLFTGPPGVGKTRAALAFSCELISQGDPAGRAMFTRAQHPDFFSASRDKTRIGIDEIRRMEEWLAYRPYMSSRRVVLIREAHLLSGEAANALLKTLEEPPGYAVLILVSDENNALPTIISRCQEVRFFPLPASEIEKLLIDEKVDENRARILAYLSRGSIGRARILAGRPGIEQVMEQIHSFLQDVSVRGELAILEKADQLEKDEVERMVFLSSMEIVLRDLLVYCESGQEELLVVRDNMALAHHFSRQNAWLKRMLTEIAVVERKLHTNVNPLLLTVNLLLKFRQVLQGSEIACR